MNDVQTSRCPQDVPRKFSLIVMRNQKKGIIENKAGRLIGRWALICLFSTLFLSCNKEKDAIRQMCWKIRLEYPKATLQDVYKTCYQDYFGAEHLMSDTNIVRMYLHKELEECCSTDMSLMPEEEATGFRHRFTRINLSEVIDGKLTEDQLLSMFLDAAGTDEALGDNWEDEWGKIVTIALRVNPDWFDPDLLSELQEAAHKKQAVRHSEAFRTAYNPHYRIVKR